MPQFLFLVKKRKKEKKIQNVKFLKIYGKVNLNNLNTKILFNYFQVNLKLFTRLFEGRDGERNVEQVSNENIKQVSNSARERFRKRRNAFLARVTISESA